MSQTTQSIAKTEKKRVPFLFTYVDVLSHQETLDEIERRIRDRQPTQHVVINAGKIVLMEKNKQLREIVNQCPIINADGQSVVWASKFLGNPLPERVTGIDLMYDLVALAAEKSYRIYLFGAKEEVVYNTKVYFEQKYPSLQVAGYRNGYFTEDDEECIIKDMRESKADLLFIAFSSPKKEIWVQDHISQINIPFVMGVGGSFDIVAGETRRAPGWMQKLGLEWFYRFLQEPRRMFKRYFVGNLTFISLVLKDKHRRGRSPVRED